MDREDIQKWISTTAGPPNHQHHFNHNESHHHTTFPYTSIDSSITHPFHPFRCQIKGRSVTSLFEKKMRGKLKLWLYALNLFFLSRTDGISHSQKAYKDYLSLYQSLNLNMAALSKEYHDLLKDLDESPGDLQATAEVEEMRLERTTTTVRALEDTVNQLWNEKTQKDLNPFVTKAHFITNQIIEGSLGRIEIAENKGKDGGRKTSSAASLSTEKDLLKAKEEFLKKFDQDLSERELLLTMKEMELDEQMKLIDGIVERYHLVLPEEAPHQGL
jgi:hypothetical protein